MPFRRTYNVVISEWDSHYRPPRGVNKRMMFIDQHTPMKWWNNNCIDFMEGGSVKMLRGCYQGFSLPQSLKIRLPKEHEK